MAIVTGNNLLLPVNSIFICASTMATTDWAGGGERTLTQLTVPSGEVWRIFCVAFTGGESSGGDNYYEGASDVFLYLNNVLQTPKYDPTAHTHLGFNFFGPEIIAVPGDIVKINGGASNWGTGGGSLFGGKYFFIYKKD